MKKLLFLIIVLASSMQLNSQNNHQKFEKCRKEVKKAVDFALQINENVPSQSGRMQATGIPMQEYTMKTPTLYNNKIVGITVLKDGNILYSFLKKNVTIEMFSNNENIYWVSLTPKKQGLAVTMLFCRPDGVVYGDKLLKNKSTKIPADKAEILFSNVLKMIYTHIK